MESSIALWFKNSLETFFKAILGTDLGQVCKFWVVNLAPEQCCAINVGFELHIVIESNISILNIGFDFEMGKFGHFDFDIDIISIQYQYQ